MLTERQTAIIKATVPALRAHGETITRHFYGKLFSKHPELFNLFNPASQRDGGQPRSLAASVLAYAENIDQLDRLAAMVERIATKHVSLEVLPEHYPIVGQFLLGAISEVLGEAATPEILEAWGAAYGQLADIMIGRERSLYTEGATQSGGWAGFKPFRIARRVAESEVITSFVLEPEDGAPLPGFRAGQYISVKVKPPGLPHVQIRQYSLSAAPNGRSYRISVRREDAPAPGAPRGVVSCLLHEAFQERDTVLVHAPVGDFTLAEGQRPVVLLSGGAGITAVRCMLEELAGQPGREVVFIHAARSRAQQAFAEEIRELAARRPGIRSVTFHEEVGPTDVQGTHYDVVGRISAAALRPWLPQGEADFYVCGPLGFMAAAEAALDELGVPAARRHNEAFAPDPAFIAAA